MRLRAGEVGLYLRMEHVSIICARLWALQIYLLNLRSLPRLHRRLYVFFGSDHSKQDPRHPGSDAGDSSDEDLKTFVGGDGGCSEIMYW